jgi:hypothetical protein
MKKIKSKKKVKHDYFKIAFLYFSIILLFFIAFFFQNGKLKKQSYNKNNSYYLSLVPTLPLPRYPQSTYPSPIPPITKPNFKNGIYTSMNKDIRLHIPNNWKVDKYEADPLSGTKDDGTTYIYYNEYLKLTNNKNYYLAFANADGPPWSCSFEGERESDSGREDLYHLTHYSYLNTSYGVQLRVGRGKDEYNPERIYFNFCKIDKSFGDGYYNMRAIGITAPQVDAPEQYDLNIINEAFEIIKTAEILKK